MALIERNGDGKINWWAILRSTVPLVILFGMVFFYFTDRLETDEEKRVRIATMMGPLVAVVESNTAAISLLVRDYREHSHEDGHAPMVARVNALERAFMTNHAMLVQIQEDIKRLLRDRP